LIYEDRGEPSGFVSFERLRCSKVADWGFYLAPHSPAGSGSFMGRLALDYAFGELLLHKICGQALAFNERSIGLHRKLCFRDEGRLREQHFDGEEYHDVICFGLLGLEWKVGAMV